MQLSTRLLAILAMYCATTGLMAADNDPPKPAELKVLERLVGKWDSVAVNKVAVWTPEEIKVTALLTREMAMGGRFLQEKASQYDGEALVLFGYDPAKSAYRMWRFDSRGNAMDLSGKWDEGTQTFTFTGDLDGGLKNTTLLKFVDVDTHEWKAIVKDGTGKVYYDGSGTCKRRK